MGKTRIIAETGAGQHGVATATAARAVRPAVRRLHGRGGHQAPGAERRPHARCSARGRPGRRRGSRTLKDAMNEALRDWVANVDTTHYCIGTVGGPHPFPVMVRDFQRVIGEEARAQIPGAQGALPDAVIGLRRRRLERHRPLPRVHRRPRRPPLSASRPRARAPPPGGTPPPSPAARRASCTARGATCCRTRTARRWRRTRSPPARLPGRRARARLAEGHRPGHVPRCHRRRGDGGVRVLCRTEGIIPAIESSHALAGALNIGRELGPGGRSSSTSPVVAIRMSTPRPDGSTYEREVLLDVGSAFDKAKAENRAALVGYLPAGLPQRRRRHRGGSAMARSGADTSRSACRTPIR